LTTKDRPFKIMELERLPIDGLCIVHPRVFDDDRGFFFESYNQDKFRRLGIDLNWAQDNHARSIKGTVRGLHFQSGRGQAKLARCARGRLWDVAVDIRPGSPTLGRWHAVELTEDNKNIFFIPAGFAHGYCALSDVAEALYKCDSVYDPALESEIAWNDPDIGIDWPEKNPVLSKRDQSAQSLREYLTNVRRG
jgi:dTDP-4-dehydrorhamnose 3,5-epimerase